MATIPQTHQERIWDINSCYSLITAYATQFGSQKVNSVNKEDCKSSHESEALRNKGNNLLSKKEFSAACTCYTQSLFFSSSDLETAYAYGNRSAALYHLKYYQACLIDIDRCLKLEYPLEKRWRLYVRAADCHAKLQRSCLEQALKTGNVQQHQDINERISQLNHDSNEYKCHAAMDVVNIRPYMSDNSKSDMKLLSTEGGNVPKLLQVKYSEERGFGVYCVEDVPAGTPLLLEKPYSCRLHTKLFNTHCYGCFARCNTLLPCPTCSMVGFCSETCQLRCMEGNNDFSQNSFPKHRYECGFINSILKRDGHVGLLAYGCVADADIHQLCATLQHLLNEDSGNVFISKKRDSQLKLQSALLLATNCKFRSKNDQNSRMQSALLYASMLQASGYFHDVDSDEKSSQPNIHAFVSLALFLFLQSVPTNAHSSSEAIVYEDHKLELNDPKRDLAHGLYPFLSLINHACDPNVVRIGYNGSSIVLFALRPVHTGEEIVDNYSIHYALMSTGERQDALRKQYLFDCDCIACRENWPIYEEIVKAESFKFTEPFSDNNHRIKMCLCDAQEKARLQFDEVLSSGSQNSEKIHQLISALVSYSDLLHGNVHKPQRV